MSIRRRVLQRALRPFKIEPIAFWRLQNFSHVSHLSRLLEHKSVDCVFDVGAYDGHFGRFLRSEVGYKGKIISFEPQPEKFDKLEQCSKLDPNWMAINCALGSQDGSVELNVMRGSSLSSVLQPSKEMPNNMAPHNVVEERVEVSLKRLDSLFPELATQWQIRSPFLKIDTQGYDLEVFRGASACIDNFVLLQSEVSVIQLYDNSPRWHEALAEYSAAGFGLSGLFPVSFDDESRVIEFDAVLVRPQEGTGSRKS